MTRTKKPRLGRPSLGSSGRTSVLSLKISEDERTAWGERASTEDVTLSEWIRERCNRE